MDLGPIGAHCALRSCNALDLLPIACPHCAHKFCRAHSAPDSHTCLSAPQSRPLTSADKLERCAVDICTKTALSMMSADVSAGTVRPTCAQCSGFYCAQHRHPDSHRCPGLMTQSNAVTTSRNDTARALLAKNFPSTAKPAPKLATKSKKLPTDPVKLAQYRRVEAMKMRHKARPGDPRDTNAPLEERLHIYVRSPEAPDTKTLWVRKVRASLSLATQHRTKLADNADRPCPGLFCHTFRPASWSAFSKVAIPCTANPCSQTNSPSTVKSPPSSATTSP
ncbi:hypothetical protein HDZ31DRAFT_41306 [Schizophyllum fasciatum]